MEEQTGTLEKHVAELDPRPLQEHVAKLQERVSKIRSKVQTALQEVGGGGGGWGALPVCKFRRSQATQEYNIGLAVLLLLPLFCRMLYYSGFPVLCMLFVRQEYFFQPLLKSGSTLMPSILCHLCLPCNLLRRPLLCDTIVQI